MKDIVFLLISLIVLTLLQNRKRSKQVGGAKLDGWYQDPKCTYGLLNVYKQFNKLNELNENTSESWSLYMPCGYNNAEREYLNIKSTDDEQKIFIIKGCDNLSRKDVLWKCIKDMYGDKANEIMPETYELFVDKDLIRLRSDYELDNVYILKKNIQRQEGLKMTKSLTEMLNAYNYGYVIAQEMLQDPLLVNGRKTNFRVYLLIVCKNGVKRGYVYNDGYVYYTPKDFKPYSTDKDSVITAGLSTHRKDNDFYKGNPLTIKQLEKDIGKDLTKKTEKMLEKVLRACNPKFCNTGYLKEQTTFQLFGCDIAYNDKYMPQLIEINKGPDLSSGSEEESKLKNDLITNVFKIVGIPIKVPLTGTFTHIWTGE